MTAHSPRTVISIWSNAEAFGSGVAQGKARARAAVRTGYTGSQREKEGGKGVRGMMGS